MGKSATVVIFIIAMAAIIVAVDILFFRHHFWERLSSNVGIVLIFIALYFRYLHH